MKKGFTLIELLVVVSIIAILSAVGLSAFAGAQKKARDSRRKADIVQIQNASEKVFLDSTNGQYVAPGAASYAAGTVPVDPLAGSAYSSTYTTFSYRLCASLEGTTTAFCTNNLQ